MQRTGIGNGPPRRPKGRDKILHFEQFAMNCGLSGGNQRAMVDGAQRMDFPVDLRHHAFGVRGLGGLDQLFQKSLGDIGHIAGDDQIPVTPGKAKSGIEPSDRPAIFDRVGHDGKAQMRVLVGRPDQRHIAGGGLDSFGDFLDHARTPERQQGFVASHPPAGSAHQHEPGASHEMILATSSHIVESNKKVYICFLMAFAMLAASPSRAADSNSATTPPVVRKTTVVRADPRTGKLVRSVVVSSRPAITKIAMSAGASSSDVNAIVDKASRANDVDPLLVHSIIKVESNYNVHAVSNKGAEGLMQLTPSTARMLGVSNSFDPRQNIEAGVKYLKYLKDLYKDDRLALAAYNAGPGSVDKYNAIPPYAETQNYVYQVGKRYGEARRAADAVAELKNAEMKNAEAKLEVKTLEEKPAEVKPAAVEPFIDQNGRLHLKTTQ